MNKNDLRRRLEHIDPIPESTPVEHPTSPSARNRLEHIMTTNNRPNRRPRAAWIAAAAAALVLVVGLVAIATRGDDDPDTVALPATTTVLEPTTAPPAATLELALPGGTTLTSCVPFDVSILADMSPAFAATATAVEGANVTLTIDRWYTGGDADNVRLLAPEDQAALLDGFAFEVGEQYLITAANGTVNFCGYSGPATPELTNAFDQAFAS